MKRKRKKDKNFFSCPLKKNSFCVRCCYVSNEFDVNVVDIVVVVVVVGGSGLHGLRRQLVAKTAAAAPKKKKKFRGFAASDKLCGGGREEIQDERKRAHLRS